MWFGLGTINHLKPFSYLTVRVFNELKGILLSFNIGKFFLKYSRNESFLLVCHKFSMIFHKEIIIFDMKQRSEFGCVFVSPNMMKCVGVLIYKVRVRKQVRTTGCHGKLFISVQKVISLLENNQLRLN